MLSLFIMETQYLAKIMKILRIFYIYFSILRMHSLLNFSKLRLLEASRSLSAFIKMIRQHFPVRFISLEEIIKHNLHAMFH